MNTTWKDFAPPVPMRPLSNTATAAPGPLWPRSARVLSVLVRPALGLALVLLLWNGPAVSAHAQPATTVPPAPEMPAALTVANAVPPVPTEPVETRVPHVLANTPAVVPSVPVARPTQPKANAVLVAQASPAAPTEPQVIRAPRAPENSRPVDAPPSALGVPPTDKPVKVGQLSPADLKARQDADARRQAAALHPDPAVDARVAADNSAPAPRDDARAEPQTPVDYLKDNEWQRHAEIRSGNVTVLRRSTDEPPAPNETVILRWRTPTEFRNNAFMSSKGHTPNQLGK